MKYLVRIHYYLGVFFAPLIIFFAASGAWQLFMLHRRMKNSSYVPPEWMEKLSRLHQFQTGLAGEPSAAFKYLSLAMALGLIATAALGIAVALKRYPGRQKWGTLGCLAAGAAVPVLLAL